MNYTNPVDSTEIRVENGLIRFDDYELYKKRAEEARDYLMSLDVTPENEQECKHTVATARKISDQLNQERIRVKKKILEPYSALEEKVEEIIAIVSEGENVARDKLKAIENRRREMKTEQIRDIWNARCDSFECGKYLGFDQFMLDRYLNRTVPLSEVEKEMVKFLVEKSEDILFLNKQPRKDEYIAEYVNCLSATKAMEIVDRRYETIKANATESYMVIRISGKADVILAKQMLKDINYKVLEEK